jgi:adenosylmethionine-8-amino-7-oxononanoate transaminase
MKEYLQDDPIIIERGQGVKLIDVNGKEYYDGCSSMWLNPLGHNHPELNKAIEHQLQHIAHSTLLGSANIPSILLAERLIKLSCDRLQKVFFSDSGAEAVEIALKIAFLYWKNRGYPEKELFVSLKNAYHGDTVGAVSVGGIEAFHSAFGSLLFETEKISYPYPYRYPGTAEACSHVCIQELRTLFQEKADRIAGLIVEPMVQGAGGIIVMPEGFLSRVEKLCREYDVLLIADEVATGFGRTGELFACNHEGVQPDLMAIGKMLTGGYLPVAATLISDEIYNVFYGEKEKTFYHGHSYTGNQLGCAVALATLDLYEKHNLVSHVKEMCNEIQVDLSELAQLPHVGEIRQLGFMIGIELVKDKETKEPFFPNESIGKKVCARAENLGLFTRPLDDTITFLPPLISTREELKEMIQILSHSIQEVTSSCVADYS